VFVKTIFNEESQMLIKWEKGRCYYFFCMIIIYLFIYFLTITLLLLSVQLIRMIMCASVGLIIGISQQKSLIHLPRKDNGCGLLVVGLCIFLHSNLVKIGGIILMRMP